MNLSRSDIISLLSETDASKVAAILADADHVRAENLGGDVHLRGLIEISNHCSRNCLYCGLRNSNRRLARYRMSAEESVDTARRAAARGRKTVVLQSGEDPELTPEFLFPVVKQIKDLDVAVTLSLGEYSREDYFRMRDAGADRYLLKHETIDPVLYKSLNPGMSLEIRLRCHQWLREAGFQVGSGFMVGLPGQTLDSIADDILYLRDFGVDMAGMGPFVPHPETPLADAATGDPEMTLRVIAVSRLAMPLVHIPATTALASILPNGTVRALCCGANVIMPNNTPAKYREMYQLYPGRIPLREVDENPDFNVETIVNSIGRTIATDHGHSRRKESARLA